MSDGHDKNDAPPGAGGTNDADSARTDGAPPKSPDDTLPISGAREESAQAGGDTRPAGANDSQTDTSEDPPDKSDGPKPLSARHKPSRRRHGHTILLPPPPDDPDYTDYINQPKETPVRRPFTVQNMIRSILEKVRMLLDMDIEETGSRGVRWAIYGLKVIRESVRMTGRDQCMIRAQALSYKTILSLVPVITVMMAILSIGQLSDRRDEVLDKLANLVVPGEDITARVTTAFPAEPAAAGPSPIAGTGSEPSRAAHPRPNAHLLPFVKGDLVEYTVSESESAVPVMDGDIGYGIVLKNAPAGDPVQLKILGYADPVRNRASSLQNTLDQNVSAVRELSPARYNIRRRDKRLFQVFRRNDWIRIDAAVLADLNPDNMPSFEEYRPNMSYDELKADVRDMTLYMRVEATPLRDGNGYLVLADALRDGVTFTIPMTGMSKLKPLTHYKILGAGANGRLKVQFLSNIEKLTANAGAVGLIGFIFLIYTIYLVLSAVEESLNHIWEVTRGRDVFSRMILYTAIMFWGPLFLMMTFSTTEMLKGWSGHGMISRIMFLPLPILINSLAFAVMYRVLPNTKVKWKVALFGGVIAGILWELCKQLLRFYFKEFLPYDKVYGSLGLIPMLMLLTWLTWFITLLGSEITFVLQNFREIEQKARREKLATRHRVYYALRIMLEIGRRFKEGRHAERVTDVLADTLSIPEYVVRSICDVLVEKNLLLPAGANQESYVPARELSGTGMADLLDAIRGDPLTVSSQVLDIEHRYIDEIFRTLNQQERERIRSLTFEAMLEQLARRGVGMSKSQRTTAATVRTEPAGDFNEQSDGAAG